MDFEELSGLQLGNAFCFLRLAGGFFHGISSLFFLEHGIKNAKQL